jgi:hypothetical protein
VNFKPERKIIPGPPGHEFPPAFASPGAVGDANYGPLVPADLADGFRPNNVVGGIPHNRARLQPVLGMHSCSNGPGLPSIRVRGSVQSFLR